jgi:hypothetical protein
MPDLGRTLVFLGLLLVFAGALVMLLSRAGGLPLGRLPGDIVYRRDGFTFYLPLTTSILVSVVLSLLFYLFRR